MRVLLATSPLPGLDSVDVGDVVSRAWLSSRPDDEVRWFAVSDGETAPFVGSGAHHLFGAAESVALSEEGERRFAYRTSDSYVLDYTERTATDGGELEGSEHLGRDLLGVRAMGAGRVDVVLPKLGPLSDLGIGAINVLAGAGGADSADATSGVVEGRGLAERLARARDVLRGIDLRVWCGGEQRLTGLSGVAYAWSHEGLPLERAQDAEREISALAATLRAAVPTDLLGQGLDTRGPWSGCGGGLAVGLAALGARVLPIRHAVAEVLAPAVQRCDLVVYVCGHIGVDLPDGLHAAVDCAMRAGIPVVTIYDSGALRRGELAKLGLNGAYELRPERAFAASADTPDSVAPIVEALGERVAVVARTWGW